MTAADRHRAGKHPIPEIYHDAGQLTLDQRE
jgi:hypothetical protein